MSKGSIGQSGVVMKHQSFVRPILQLISGEMIITKGDGEENLGLVCQIHTHEAWSATEEYHWLGDSVAHLTG